MSDERDQGNLVFVREERQGTFELQDLLRASAEVLGSGEFGSSYKAVLLNGPAVVVKRFKEMNRLGGEEFEGHMRRLGNLSHPNLLPLVAYYYREEEKLLVTEFVPCGSLASLLHGKKNLFFFFFIYCFLQFIRNIFGFLVLQSSYIIRGEHDYRLR